MGVKGEGYNRRTNSWKRDPECINAPQECSDAMNKAQCDLVVGTPCSYVGMGRDQKCVELTECVAAKSEKACNNVGGCGWDSGRRQGSKWLRMPSCQDKPAKCSDA